MVDLLVVVLLTWYGFGLAAGVVLLCLQLLARARRAARVQEAPARVQEAPVADAAEPVSPGR